MVEPRHYFLLYVGFDIHLSAEKVGKKGRNTTDLHTCLLLHVEIQPSRIHFIRFTARRHLVRYILSFARRQIENHIC